MATEYATLIELHHRVDRDVTAPCCPHASVSTEDVEAPFHPGVAASLFELIVLP